MSWRRDERGFTLIEIAVSLSVFAIVMVSLTLLFDTSLETASRTRFDELGKTVAQQKLEEIRSLPYHIAWTEESGDVDVLDLYFPNLTGTTSIPGATGAYDPTANVWTFTTTQEPVTADGRDFRVQTALQFVAPLDTGALQPLAPLAGYDSNAANVDEPAANAVRAVVTVSRTFGGQTRSQSLETVISQAEEDRPSVEASGSVLGAQVSGLSFQDGDGPGGVAAEILATVAASETAFREVAESTSQASSDPVEIVERDPVTGVPIQPDGPSAGESSASVPNSTDGTVQSTSGLNASDVFSSWIGTDVIASWDAASPASTSEARVSLVHTLNPEGRTAVRANNVQINSREEGDAVPLAMVSLDEVTGSVEQTSTTVQARVRSVVDIVGKDDDDDDDDDDDGSVGPAVSVVATRQFDANSDFEGVLTIESLHVDVEAVAGTTSASTAINWTVENLRVWDPNLNGPGLGGYGPAYSFGMISTCGGWVDDPDDCGLARTDGKAQFENPNPVVIPSAYAGTDNAGATGASLSVVAGVTVREANADAANGISNASLSQKNVLSITTRDDLAGAVDLEPMLLGVGDANASVSYIIHEH
jgi:prepilin-type N-terminal cleavage/methylation domain-containing protein